jgi:hypothetical protein
MLAPAPPKKYPNLLVYHSDHDGIFIYFLSSLLGNVIVFLCYILFLFTIIKISSPIKNA